MKTTVQSIRVFKTNHLAKGLRNLSLCCSPGFKNLADVGTYLHKLMLNGLALRLVDTAVTALEFCTLSRAVIRFYMWVSMKIFLSNFTRVLFLYGFPVIFIGYFSQ
jgi:hypothetical protein